MIAFGLQPFAGYICDKRPNIPIGIAGCFLVTIGLLSIRLPWCALILCAFGNACFHVGGGIDSLKFANGKMSRSGVFVSSGAIGVSLGILAGNIGYSYFLLPLILMILSVILLYLFTRRQKTQALSQFYTVSNNLPAASVIALALISVAIRSYGGSILPIKWNVGALILFPSICACAGKAVGGFLGDKFGARKTGVFALILSVPFLYFGENNAILAMIGILLFNITMPITLCTVASVLNHNPGFSFGLTTLALLCGNIPVYFWAVSSSLRYPVLIGFILISACCTFFSTKKGVKSNEKEKY